MKSKAMKQGTKSKAAGYEIEIEMR